MREFITPNMTVCDTDRASIQEAVALAIKEGSRRVVIPRYNERTREDKWVIDGYVRLPSDFEVVLDGCYMVMADEVVGGFFCSETLFTTDAQDLSKRLHNIKISGKHGAVLDGGRPTGLNESTQLELGVPVRANSPIFFMNVEGFAVENLEIRNQRYWGMRFEFCSDGVIRDIYFDIKRDRFNQDGINLRNGCSNILIENISGQTGDDMIALSAIDYDGPSPFGDNYRVIVKGHDWDIHDVTIRNVSGAAITHPLVALRNHNGAKMYNITIENLCDTAQIRPVDIYDGWPRYALLTIGVKWYYREKARPGDTYNIQVRGLHAEHSLAPILLGSVVRDLEVKDVYAGGIAKSVVTVIGDNWGDDCYGVKLDGAAFENVRFEASAPDACVFNFRFMGEDDYLDGLVLKSSQISGASVLAEVNKKAKRVDIKVESSNLSCPENSIIRVSPPEMTRAERIARYAKK